MLIQSPAHAFGARASLFPEPTVRRKLQELYRIRRDGGNAHNQVMHLLRVASQPITDARAESVESPLSTRGWDRQGAGMLG